MIYSSDNQTDSGNFVRCEVFPFTVSFDTEEAQVEIIIIKFSWFRNVLNRKRNSDPWIQHNTGKNTDHTDVTGQPIFVENAFSSGNEMWSIRPMTNSYFIILLNYVQRQPMAFRVLDCQQQQLIEQRDLFFGQQWAKRRNEKRKT